MPPFSARCSGFARAAAFVLPLTLIALLGEAHAARRVSFQEAWPRARTVVRGLLVARHWRGPPATRNKGGRIVYVVHVDEVWKGAAHTWIRVTEPVRPGVEGCDVSRPRAVGTGERFFFFLRPRSDGLFESAAWGGCGLYRLASPAERKHLVARHPQGPAAPIPARRPRIPVVPASPASPVGSRPATCAGCGCEQGRRAGAFSPVPGHEIPGPPRGAGLPPRPVPRAPLWPVVLIASLGLLLGRLRRAPHVGGRL